MTEPSTWTTPSGRVHWRRLRFWVGTDHEIAAAEGELITLCGRTKQLAPAPEGAMVDCLVCVKASRTGAHLNSGRLDLTVGLDPLPSQPLPEDTRHQEAASMTIRAKFYVSDVDNPEGATAATVKLGAVCRGIENSMWAQYTPAGFMQMSIKNDLATEQFARGDEWEIVMRKVTKPQLGDGHPIVRAVTPKGEIVCETCGLNLGWTEKGIESYGEHMRQYMTPENEAQKVADHEEAYGAKE